MAREDPEAQWEPPTEAEMKIMQARRDRQDKISSITGEYLLRGYKMLDSICDLCGTILLQDRKGKLYCVACSEVDTDEHVKDDPAMSNSAAKRQAEELRFSSADGTEAGPSVSPVSNMVMSNCIASVNEHSIPQTVVNKQLNSSIPSSSCLQLQESPSQDCYLESTIVLKEKINWVTKQLKSSQNVNRSIQLCSLLKGCAEALLCLKQLENQCLHHASAHSHSSEQRKLGK